MTQPLSMDWLTVAQENAVVGSPAAETWPGPVSENHDWPGPRDPGRMGPPEGQAPPPSGAPAAVTLPDLSGGMIADNVGLLGHSAPMAGFDSAAGPAFAPSGPVAATHAMDTGGTDRKEHVPVPRSPGWWRRVLTGQTWNRQAQVTDTAGWAQSVPNDRTDRDEYTGQNADGYDPRVIPYSERPVRANFAATSYPVGAIGSVYGVQGSPGLAYLGGQGNATYQTPPDPVTTTQTAAAGQTDPLAGLGLSYG